MRPTRGSSPTCRAIAIRPPRPEAPRARPPAAPRNAAPRAYRPRRIRPEKLSARQDRPPHRRANRPARSSRGALKPSRVLLDLSLSLLGDLGGLQVGAITRAHQRPGLDMLKAHPLAGLGELREFGGRHPALHRQMARARAQILAQV